MGAALAAAVRRGAGAIASQVDQAEAVPSAPEAGHGIPEVALTLAAEVRAYAAACLAWAWALRRPALAFWGCLVARAAVETWSWIGLRTDSARFLWRR